MSESPFDGTRMVASTVESTTLIEGRTFCISAANGDLQPDHTHGLFVLDRRVMSRFELRIDGTLSFGADNEHRGRRVLATDSAGQMHTRRVAASSRDERSLTMSKAFPTVAGSSWTYELWDADTAVAELRKVLDAYPMITDIHFWAQFPGESVESGNRRLAYIAENVLPRLR